MDLDGPCVTQHHILPQDGVARVGFLFSAALCIRCLAGPKVTGCERLFAQSISASAGQMESG